MFLLVALIRVVAFVLGLSLLYISLMFTKDDDGRVQNWLVGLWVRVESTSTKRDRALAFFHEIAALINRLFDRLFGAKLLSLQFGAASLTLSICSLYFASILRFGEHTYGRVFYLVLFSGSCLIAELVINSGKTSVSIAAAAFGLIALCWLNLHWTKGGAFDSSVQELPIVGGLILGMVVDAGAIATARRMLRKQEVDRELSRLVGTMGLMLMLGIVLMAPSWPYFSGNPSWGALHDSHPIRFVFLWTVVVASATSLVAALCALSLAFVAGMALCHKALWRLASKLIHVCYERRVVENRVLLFALGSMLLSYSVQWFSWLRQLPH